MPEDLLTLQDKVEQLLTCAENLKNEITSGILHPQFDDITDLCSRILASVKALNTPPVIIYYVM